MEQQQPMTQQTEGRASMGDAGGPRITISRASDRSLALHMKERLAASYLDTGGEAKHVCPF